jgi:predicted peptidase
MRKPLKLVSDFIDTLISAGQVDLRRIYIGGLSMGGFGTFELLWRRPGFFAAAIPICGAGNHEKTSTYKANFPMWIFHGEKDPVIPVANSRLIYETMKKTNNKVRYTEYPGIGHNSWVNAFAEPTILPWLFEQKLTSKKK